jgi:hypothetical protein
MLKIMSGLQGGIPFGQKSQTRFFTRSYELAIACSSACNPAHNRQYSTSIVGK